MPCNEWKDEWVAHLYGELDAAEERGLTEHLAACSDCSNHMDELSSSRELLRSYSPSIPATPRVVVLRPRGFFQPFWAYASGAACALLLFSIGLLAGYNLPGFRGAADDGGPVATARPHSDEILPITAAGGDDALRQELDMLKQRLVSLEQATAGPMVSGSPDPYLTRAQFQDAMNSYRRAYDARHARDFEFLLKEITATELRTGTYIDETREALRWVAMKNDPRFTER
jgi:hypothetical protein